MVDLPEPALDLRWTPERKQAVIEAIERGRLSVAEALARYGLSLEEVDSWRRGIVSLRALQARQGATWRKGGGGSREVEKTAPEAPCAWRGRSRR